MASSPKEKEGLAAFTSSLLAPTKMRYDDSGILGFFNDDDDEDDLDEDGSSEDGSEAPADAFAFPFVPSASLLSL